nr:hypothetical protein [Actinocrinis puniceicyclus]
MPRSGTKSARRVARMDHRGGAEGHQRTGLVAEDRAALRVELRDGVEDPAHSVARRRGTVQGGPGGVGGGVQADPHVGAGTNERGELARREQVARGEHCRAQAQRVAVFDERRQVRVGEGISASVEPDEPDSCRGPGLQQALDQVRRHEPPARTRRTVAGGEAESARGRAGHADIKVHLHRGLLAVSHPSPDAGHVVGEGAGDDLAAVRGELTAVRNAARGDEAIPLPEDRVVRTE